MAKINNKGWGDGDATIDYNKRRKRNPECTYTGFRPRIENEAAYYIIRRWGDDPQVKRSFSALINALLPGLKVALENTTEYDEETGHISVELNLGRINII